MNFVSILMGSKSDYETMKEAAKTLESFGVKYELIISSAHRSPKRTKEYIANAEEKGAKVFIAAAGMAAHLAGAVAAYTTKPFGSAYVRKQSCKYGFFVFYGANA